LLPAYYSDTFALPLPSEHRFPLEKYRLLREHLQSGPLSGCLDLRMAAAATDEQLLLVHTQQYLDKLVRGELTRVEERRIGFPWSPEMVERSRRSTGATIGAARAALDHGAAAHLAGGTHHAFPDHGQGYCVFNDVAVAFQVLRREGLAGRAAVIDLDVHQGNGTAAIFAEDPGVFTFSMHGDRNFPFAKCDGDLDIALPDGTTDETYLAALADALATKVPLAAVDIAFYLAGADPFHEDRFGKLKLTRAGLARRDRLVLQHCAAAQLPVAVVMAGGYAKRVEDVVAINTATIAALLEAWPPPVASR
jgi:acetoin utilization deacetylase AcuC-like enzyme